MPRIYSIGSQIESIDKQIISYLKGHTKIPQNVKIRQVWSVGTHDPINSFSGQFEYKKMLRNGNEQTRVVTAYGNGNIGTTTVVKSPQGELLKVYNGVIEKHWHSPLGEIDIADKK